MPYSNFFLARERKIPTFFLFIILIAVFIFLSRFLGFSPPRSSAAKSALKYIEIVNLSYNQAAVFWQTQEKAVGWVIYGENESNLTSIVLDDRDVAEKKGSYLNHLATLKNLKEGRVYSFKIVSNNKLIGNGENKAFSFKTSSSLSSSSNLKPVYGKIINRSGRPLDNAAVVLAIGGAYPLVAVTKLGGDWLIPLNNIVEKNTGKVKFIDSAERIRIDIYAEDSDRTSVESTISNASPLPQTIIIGRDYDLQRSADVLSATSKSQVVETASKVEILYPRESSIIPGTMPLIKGIANPGSELVVIVNSEKSFSFRIRADKDGVWKVPLSESLSPGPHKITVVFQNSEGLEQSLIRMFTIAKSGEQVLGIATPDATPTSSATPTLIFTPTTPLSSQEATAPPTSGTSPLFFALASGSLIVLGIGLLLVF